jgi:tRNA dimethylallyltransferase
MLYFKALRDGLSDLPGADPSVRGEIEARAAALGWPAMHAELSRVDPVTAARLDRNDAQRIQRALEVHAITGKPISALQGGRAAAPADDFVAFAMFPADRADLHRRIADRFDAMLAAGLVDEVRALRDRHALTADMASMRCVGYRQTLQFLDGDGDRAALRERAIAATRQLARRQMTWLRSTSATILDSSRNATAVIAERIAAAIEATETATRHG